MGVGIACGEVPFGQCCSFDGFADGDVGPASSMNLDTSDDEEWDDDVPSAHSAQEGNSCKITLEVGQSRDACLSHRLAITGGKFVGSGDWNQQSEGDCVVGRRLKGSASVDCMGSSINVNAASHQPDSIVMRNENTVYRLSMANATRLAEFKSLANQDEKLEFMVREHDSKTVRVQL